MEGYLQLELERFLANREDVKRMKINKETFFWLFNLSSVIKLMSSFEVGAWLFLGEEIVRI